MKKVMYWTKEENDELSKYFSSNMGEMALYQRLHNINPNRSYEGMARKLRLLREQGVERNKTIAINKLRVGYLDIESSSLDGDVGYMLSWFIKKAGKNEYESGLITKKEIFNYEFDKRILRELLRAFKNYDVLYTHYGSDRRFDVPFIRTRAYVHRIESELPTYMENFILDTYPIARNKLKLHNNRLGTIGEALGIDITKTPLSLKKWCLASVGEPKALKYVYNHNKTDVKLLEKIAEKLKVIERPIYKSI